MDQVSLAAAQALSLLFSAAFLSYWISILVAYLRRKPLTAGDAATYEWHIFVPCRDEAAVIGTTLTYLRSTFPSADVWVIDDDSADATAAIVQHHAASDPKVHLIRRRFPEARTGKGDALNTAYRALRVALRDDADLTRVIVGVVDADGRPSPNCLEVCAGDDLFGDPEIGGVQIEVRIMNTAERRPLPDRGRSANLVGRTLVRMQDMEFRAVIGAIQISRAFTQTVGMGGNGQFTRLSALASLDTGDQRAWRGSLLEDYELGLHLMLAGHRTAFTSETYVDQEGLPSVRRYLTQRTRWGQGVMQCMRYLPRAWNSPNLTTAGALETSYYLFQPWLTLLGTIVFPIPIVAMLAAQLGAGATIGSFLASGGWAILLFYGVLGVAPFVAWGPIYRRRCAPAASRLTGLGWGFSYLVYVYGFYITSWRAVLRIIRGEHGWSKTRRNAEFAPVHSFTATAVETSPESSTARARPAARTQVAAHSQVPGRRIRPLQVSRGYESPVRTHRGSSGRTRPLHANQRLGPIVAGSPPPRPRRDRPLQAAPRDRKAASSRPLVGRR